MDCSFKRAAAKLKKVGGIDVSVPRLPEIVEREGMVMLEARKAGLLAPNWRAEDCRAHHGAASVVLVGGDGVMVPVITAAEKAKRRAGRRHVRRRKTGRRIRRHLGADQGWKEFKIGLFYDAGKEHCHAFATGGRRCPIWSST